MPRTVVSLVVCEMEQSIKNATSMFQIGGVAGHRPQKHLFSVKSILGQYEQQKKLDIFFTNYVSKFVLQKRSL